MKYVPPLDSTDPDAGYVDGDDSTSTGGSMVAAAGIEHPQREIVAVIVAADIEPSAADLGQLNAAIDKKIGAKTAPIATTLVPGVSLRATPEDIAEKTATDKTVSPADLAGLGLNKWEARAIGERFAIQTHLVGAETPPNVAGGPRFIKLTAADAYNTGLLSDETVTGTAPLITATAVIALESSPLYGQTVHLLNTEGRFPRPGVSGVLQDDAFQGHSHAVVVGTSNGTQASFLGSGNSIIYLADGRIREPVSDGTNGTPRTAAETRPRNIAETNFMRIF